MNRPHRLVKGVIWKTPRRISIGNFAYPRLVNSKKIFIKSTNSTYRSQFPVFPSAVLSVLPVHTVPERPSILFIVSVLAGFPIALWLYKVSCMPCEAFFCSRSLLLLPPVCYASPVSAENHLHG